MKKNEIYFSFFLIFFLNIHYHYCYKPSSIITDEIIRVNVPIWKKDYKSVAIEGSVAVPTDFDVEELEGNAGVRIKTKEVTLEIGDDFKFECMTKPLEPFDVIKMSVDDKDTNNNLSYNI